jgi:hypothetical protein
MSVTLLGHVDQYLHVASFLHVCFFICFIIFLYMLLSVLEDHICATIDVNGLHLQWSSVISCGCNDWDACMETKRGGQIIDLFVMASSGRSHYSCMHADKDYTYMNTRLCLFHISQISNSNIICICLIMFVIFFIFLILLIFVRFMCLLIFLRFLRFVSCFILICLFRFLRLVCLFVSSGLFIHICFSDPFLEINLFRFVFPLRPFCQV